MERLFERHYKRKHTSLDGAWHIKFDADKVGEAQKYNEKMPCDATGTIVPSCFNMELDNFYHEGDVWYFKTFKSTKEKAKLIFHGVSGQSKVFLDGKLIAEHYSEFTKFEVELENLEAKEHFLAVKCDNYNDELITIPLTLVDWYHYGGIVRSVEFQEFDNTYIKNVNVSYTLDEELENATLELNANVVSNGNEDCVKVYIENELVFEEKFNESKNITATIELKDVKLWDIGEGNLYTVKFETANDDISERVGFRKIEVVGAKILLNKKEVFIKGVNRHDEHPDWGFAVPTHIQKRDIQIIKKMNCNAIRCSHYPQSDFFLDLCDDEGILIWEEIPMWHIHKHNVVNELFRERALTMTKEMITTHIHHPSIIIWGMHNECDVMYEELYDFTKEQRALVDSLDTSRIVTYACNVTLKDTCMEFADVIAVNKYIFWYTNEGRSWPDFLKAINEKMQEEGSGGKPILMSEFGAGGIFGNRTFENQRWTENYQEEKLGEMLEIFHDQENIVGTYIWQYCDIRTASVRELERPRGFNNKGLVDEFRRPKQAYYKVKELYSKY